MVTSNPKRVGPADGIEFSPHDFIVLITMFYYGLRLPATTSSATTETHARMSFQQMVAIAQTLTGEPDFLNTPTPSLEQSERWKLAALRIHTLKPPGSIFLRMDVASTICAAVVLQTAFRNGFSDTEQEITSAENSIILRLLNAVPDDYKDPEALFLRDGMKTIQQKLFLIRMTAGKAF